MKNALTSTCLLAGLSWMGVVPAFGNVSAQFNLLTWDASQATPQLPSAVDLKPSGAMPAAGDWLIFTGDDGSMPSGNPQGALSHNFADLNGAGGAGFNMAPSLTGSLTLEFEQTGANNWNLSVTDLTYAGRANAMVTMNQYLVTPGSPATLDPNFNVDGVGNSGTWTTGTSGGWAIQYDMDFYFDASIAAGSVDLTFDNKSQAGYLLPVSLLTPQGLSGLTLDDPAGFYGGSFSDYLLNQIAPRLPGNATYLLVAQMDKVHPGYAAGDMPITTNGLVGNTTIAYTTSAIPEPVGLGLLGISGLLLLRRRPA